jgi:hypothetical protein
MVPTARYLRPRRLLPASYQLRTPLASIPGGASVLAGTPVTFPATPQTDDDARRKAEPGD